MQKVIRNIALGQSPGKQGVSMPQGSEVVSVCMGYSMLQLITLNDPHLPYASQLRMFQVVQGGVYFDAPTQGGEGTRMQYIGTVDQRINPMSPPYEYDLFHVFELIPIN